MMPKRKDTTPLHSSEDAELARKVDAELPGYREQLMEALDDIDDACTCTPGSEGGGWHEQRCDACLAWEMKEWSRACDYARKLGARLRRDNGVRHDLDEVIAELGIDE